MDAKDLRTETTLGERSNDVSSKFTQGLSALSCNTNTMSTNPLAKVEAPTSRPCAVIGPDRILPQPPAAEGYLKKGHYEPWPPMDNTYRQPPEYPHKMPNYLSPLGNISPRQTFQENMPRIMVQPTYNSKVNDDTNYPLDRNLSKNKINGSIEPKYCDVPYSVNPIIEQKNSEMCVPNVNNARNYPQMWHPTGVNIRPARPYGAQELYQYPEYASCAGPRPVPISRTHRAVNEDPSQVYSDPYYQESNIRFKPYPSVKERYPQARYEYVSNYSNPFHPHPFPPYKYDMQKSIPQHPSHAQVPIKYIDNRVLEPVMDGYHRPPQGPYTAPYRNQVIHPPYGPMLANNLPNKIYPYPPEGPVKPVTSNKLPYDNKMYVDYETPRNKGFPMAENLYDMRQHMKNQVIIPNFPTANMQPFHSNLYYRKENVASKNFEYMSPHMRHLDPTLNPNSLTKLSSQFSPSSIAISPSDSNTSNETAHTLGGSLEDCGYVSQSSTASIRSIDSGINRMMHNDFHRRYNYAYPSPVRTSPMSNKPEVNGNVNNNKNKKGIDVRQFLQMWNEGDEENGNNSKEIASQPDFNSIKQSNQYEVTKNQEQLYVLGLMNVPSEELDKYEHIQKVSKLPENIKGYNNIELLKHFEEAIESSNLNNNLNQKQSLPRSHHPISKNPLLQALPPRPISPLDVEAKISQSVIHKEVGCNFEIKPCSPEMLNVQIATPAQNILNERTIEKVTNPLIAKSPIISSGNQLCDAMKDNHPLITLNENNKIPSCKMINTQCSNSDATNVIKTNYSLQDLESNAGVCLASLPRLDNDIELSFPEVNQQFINANKESVITTVELCTKENNDHLNSNKPKEDQENTSKNVVSELDKEFSKLSKYRKIKKNDGEKSNNFNATLRTDSVIIKNPENNKGIEHNSENQSRNKTGVDDGLLSISTGPENLSEKKLPIDIDCNNKHTVNEKALDFSWNKSENSELNEQIRCRNKSENILKQCSQQEESCDHSDYINNSGALDTNAVHLDTLPCSLNSNSSETLSSEGNTFDNSKQDSTSTSVRCSTVILNENNIIKENNVTQITSPNTLKKYPDSILKENVIDIQNVDNIPEDIGNTETSEKACMHQDGNASKMEFKSDTSNSDPTTIQNKIDPSCVSFDSPEKDDLHCNDHENENVKLNKDKIEDLHTKLNVKDEENSENSLNINTNLPSNEHTMVSMDVCERDDLVDSVSIPSKGLLISTLKNTVPENISKFNGEEIDVPSLDTCVEGSYSNKNDIPLIVENDPMENMHSSDDIDSFVGSESQFQKARDETLDEIIYLEKKSNITTDIHYTPILCSEEIDNADTNSQPEERLPAKSLDLMCLTNFDTDTDRISLSNQAFSSDLCKDSFVNNNFQNCEDNLPNDKNEISESTNSRNMLAESEHEIESTAEIADGKTAQKLEQDMQIIKTNGSDHVHTELKINIGTSQMEINETIQTPVQTQNFKFSFRKNIFSPWIQKLIMLHEGKCVSEHINNKPQIFTKTFDDVPPNLNILCIDNEIELEQEPKNENLEVVLPRLELESEEEKVQDGNLTHNIDISENKIGNLHEKTKENMTAQDETITPDSIISISENKIDNLDAETKDNMTGQADTITPDSIISISENKIDNLGDETKENMISQDDTISPDSIIIEKEVENIDSKIITDDNECDVIFQVSNSLDCEEDSIDSSLNTLQSGNLLQTNESLKGHTFAKRCLKRSLSDSALDIYNNNIQSEDSKEDSALGNPINSKKIKKHNNAFLNVINIPNNRRNSISSGCNEANMSFCIVIGNNCIISEEHVEEEKQCYDISEECFAAIQGASITEDDIDSTGEIILCPQEEPCTYVEPVILETEKLFEESWVDDVACVETVVSDDIAEDIVISAPSSPRDIEESDNDEPNILDCSYEHIEKVKYIYGDKMSDDDADFVETLYRTPHMDVNKALINRDPHTTPDCTDREENPIDYIISEPVENVFNDTTLDCVLDSNKLCENNCDEADNEQKNDISMKSFTTSASVTDPIPVEPNNECLDSIDSSESSIDDLLFRFKREENTTENAAFSSPEVSSTTVDEKNSAILLKITNFKGTRTSQLTDVSLQKNNNSCKFTENENYATYHSNTTNPRPLITKAAQKYIPPSTDTAMDDLKVKLPLPPHSLNKYKQLKISRSEQHCNRIVKKDISKKPKPRFEDVLKSIDEIQLKKHKEKSKKPKKSVPKVIIKKSENGSHYASTPTKEPYNPDLTGRKWQPWVFIEKNLFIDKMALRKKAKAIYNHRKNTYVLADKFKKYKSIASAKFVISQPKTNDASSGQFKYTIRLKHTY